MGREIEGVGRCGKRYGEVSWELLVELEESSSSSTAAFEVNAVNAEEVRRDTKQRRRRTRA